MSINWRRDEIPPEGARVVALTWHWKKHYPASMEIMGGEVYYAAKQHDVPQEWRVETDDFSGKGSYGVDGGDIDAWCFADDFRAVMPEWLNVDPPQHDA